MDYSGQIGEWLKVWFRPGGEFVQDDRRPTAELERHALARCRIRRDLIPTSAILGRTDSVAGILAAKSCVNFTYKAHP